MEPGLQRGRASALPDAAAAPWRVDDTWTSLRSEMPVSAPQTISRPAKATSSESLPALAAALEQVAGDIASVARDRESLRDLWGAIRHLEAAEDKLAQATAAMAFAASDDPTRERFTASGPSTKAVAWRLHHLSNAYRATRDACAVVAVTTTGGAWP